MPSKKTTKAKAKTVSKPKKLSSVFKLSANSIKTISTNWRVFSIVTAIYFLAYLLFVRGFATTVNVSQVKDSFAGSSIGGDFSAFNKIIQTNVNNSAGTSGSSGLLQTVLIIIFSLVYIWMLREVSKGKKINTRDSFYKSLTALIPYLIVCFYLIIETIPLIIGLFIYAAVIPNGIAVGFAEKLGWTIFTLILVSLTLYMIVSTIFALYIVTLPDVRPLQAIRSSWSLVKNRRLLVLRKVIFLPIAIIVLLLAISLIFIAIIPATADYVFFILSVSSLLLIQSYLYNLYRELI